ncbi:MAG: type 4a pilus biogenesis protein PilO [Candidatus Omnitrophica bacterium]|nr:type 4a pilus biogenesis protein PilO [Candidatus Omnitrophota bacterium]
MKPIQQWNKEDIIDFFKKVDKKTWIKIGVIAGLGLIVFVVVIWPAWFKRVQVHADIKNVKAKIESIELLRHKKSEWIHNKTDYGRYVQDVKQKLYTSGESSLLLGEVSKLAKDSGVSIIASSPQEAPVKFPEPFIQNYEARYYDFVIEGGYNALGKFASKIESYPKLLRIQRFHITPREDNPTSHLADIRLAVVATKKKVTP